MWLTVCSSLVAPRPSSFPCLQCAAQPDNPAEFGSRVYEIMALSLGSAPPAAAPSPSPSPSASSGSASEAEVVEPSEVKLEGDVWK